MIDGKTRILGVLGNPIQHTNSPAIHNFSCDLLGLNKAYLPLCYDGDDLRSLLDSLWDLGFEGLNVTVPFKEGVAELFPECGLRSVNTLSRGKDYWTCSSTDGAGFIESIGRFTDPGSFDQIVCLGNGGAALAVLKEWGLKFPSMPVKVLRRRLSKDSLFKEELKSNVQFCEFIPEELSKIIKGKKSLLVQSTSAPLSGDRLEAFVPCLSNLDGMFVDMLYGEHTSALLEESQKMGHTNCDGLGMLIGQALESQKIWWGQSASWDAVEKHLKALMFSD